MTGEQSTPAEGTPPDEAQSADAEPEETAAILDELFAVVEDRKENLPEDSYTASLFTHETIFDARFSSLDFRHVMGARWRVVIDDAPTARGLRERT